MDEWLGIDRVKKNVSSDLNSTYNYLNLLYQKVIYLFFRNV